MISVITTAYKHEKTLQRAIDSVKCQKGVEIEHIVIDDTETKNGMMNTFSDAFKRCKGEYIALCDGDDYWISDYKLKFQKDYMDSHPKVGFCITLVYTEIDKKWYRMPCATIVNKRLTFDNLLIGNAYIHAQSYFIRKSVFDKYIDFEKFIRLGFKLWDYPIVLTLINYTKFHCMDFYSAIYVKNQESVTNTKSRLKRFRYILNNFWIKLYFAITFGCKPFTLLYIAYWMIRNLYSITFKRWT